MPVISAVPVRAVRVSPSLAARDSQASRTGPKPSRSRSASPSAMAPARRASSSSTAKSIPASLRQAGGTTASCRPIGASTRFTPNPTASQLSRSAAPELSSRMPATLPPESNTSFGHFSESCASGTLSANATQSAFDAVKVRNAASAGVASGCQISVAAKLPGGFRQVRPLRPRAAVWCRATIQVGRSRSLARRTASAMVLSTSSKTMRSVPSGHSGTAVEFRSSVTERAPNTVGLVEWHPTGREASTGPELPQPPQPDPRCRRGSRGRRASSQQMRPESRRARSSHRHQVRSLRRRNT